MRSAQISFVNKKVYIIGSGKQAIKKGQSFMGEGAKVIFIAPSFEQDFTETMGNATYECIEKTYEHACEEGDIQGGFLVYACTDDSVLNHQIVTDANANNMLSASVHKDGEASYHPMKSIDYPHMHVAVSTNGAYPSYNADLLEEMEQRMEAVLYDMERSYSEIHASRLEKLGQARMERQQKRAVLVVSYGTTMKEARERNIEAIEQDVAAWTEGKDIAVYRAFSSKHICKKLAKEGVMIQNVSEAMQQMCTDGITEVTVLVTHLLYGNMYRNLVNEIEAEKKAIRALGLHACQNIRITNPLMVDQKAGSKVLACIQREIQSQHIELEEGEALVFMSHGTDGYGNMTISALNFIAKEQGYTHLFIGTMDGYPGVDIMIEQVKSAGYAKVVLMPFMLVAGNHAHHDMAAADENSWKSQLEAAGLEVRVQMQGLGELPSIRDMYLSNL